MAETKTIDGIKFMVQPFPPVEGLRLQNKLARVFGPALAETIGGIKGQGDSIADADIKLESVGKGIQSLFSSLSEDEFMALVFRLLKGCSFYVTRKDGTEVLVSMQGGSDDEAAFNQVFAGKLFSLYKIIFVVLKENYPDFFEKLRGIGGAAKTAFSSVLNDE